MQHAELELRLQGGYRMWWSTITPIVAGHLKVLKAPEFFRDIDLRWHPIEEMGGHWDIWQIDSPVRPHPLEEVDRLTRKVQITARTLGVALMSLQLDDNNRTGWLWVELFLSETEPAHNGRSVCQDWAHILRTSKDDESQEAVLKLKFDNVTPDEIAGFRGQKKLVTSDLANSRFGRAFELQTARGMSVHGTKPE
jgi:hypothetical protein